MMMRSKSGIKSVIFLYLIFVLILGVAVLLAATYFTYITTIVRPDGQVSRSDWPKQYTESFSEYFSMNDGTPQVSDAGRRSLEKNNLWVQIVDEEGSQLAEYNKPPNIPRDYAPTEMMELANNSQLNEYTVFSASTTLVNQSYRYIIGFPLHIAKINMYFNADRFSGGRPIVLGILGGVCLLVFLIGMLYGLWLTGHMSKIVKSTNAIAARAYMPRPTGGAFGDAYSSLNKLDEEMRTSDKVRGESDRMREEWIANITHDLKTPLSPIKGYAELMADENQMVSADEIRKYSRIIMKNTVYSEGLINDLKLTYQLESGVFPVSIKKVNVPRLIKEIVIDLLNNPEYSNRNIQYHSEKSEIFADIDISLIRRAVTNIVMNAVIHNAPQTEIIITVSIGESVVISVTDNGKGLTEEEVQSLFNRYYRGTSTENKPEGSGLGLAIVKHIVELHHGKIAAESELGKGTSVHIFLPISQE